MYTKEYTQIIHNTDTLIQFNSVQLYLYRAKSQQYTLVLNNQNTHLAKYVIISADSLALLSSDR